MSIFRKNPLSAGRIVDGLAFVVTAEDNTLQTLNSTGTLLWKLAQQESGVTVEMGAKALVEAFQVDLAQAEGDVNECLQAYVRKGILVQE